MSDAMPPQAEPSASASRLYGALANIAHALRTGEQLPLLADLNLANQILNENLRQQITLSEDQAMNEVVMAAMARCAAWVETGIADGQNDGQLATAAVSELLANLQAWQGRVASVPGIP